MTIDMPTELRIACNALEIPTSELSSRRLAATDAKSMAVGLLIERDLSHAEISLRLGFSSRGSVSHHARRHQDRIDTSPGYTRAYATAQRLYDTMTGTNDE